MNLKNKKIFLITGTSKGIGKSIALYYLSNENNIVIGCSRSKKTIKNSNYYHYQIDLSIDKGVDDLIVKIKKDFDHIDILINNAGIASMNHLLLTTSDKVNDILNVNLKSVINLTRDTSKMMKKSKYARIINISTIASHLNLEGESVYVSSKAAIEAFTRVIAKELYPLGITVNTIGPGPVRTDLTKNLPELKIKKLLSQLSSQEFTTPKDIINVLDFYIKEESRLVTGQIIYLN